MSAVSDLHKAEPAPARAGAWARLRGLIGRGWKGFSARASSSLTRRIVVLNLGGLVALLVGFLYLNQLREGLIEARVQSLLIQGEIIAGAIAASATIENDAITIDPDRLLQLQAGESAGPADDGFGSLEFPINPERVAPLLRRLVTPTRTRARVYDRDGIMLLDSRNLYGRGDILRFDLPPPHLAEPGLAQRAWTALRNLFSKPEAPLIEEIAAVQGRNLPEVARALGGSTSSLVRVNAAGETIVSVAVPVQRFRTVRGVLLLSTQGGDIDGMIRSERWALFRIFAVAALVMTVLSVLLANTIAGPVSRLADAAERVRRGVKTREEIPDFTARADEIGHLSGALRDMTRALYNRIEAIESFAADVAHELKNPLTSLRSAVETLPLARNEASRERLLAVIRHDVRRLDRLISDISDASRLDAELARADAEPVDMAKLLEAVVSVANGLSREDGVTVTLAVAPHPAGRDAFFVMGHDGRLGQVVNNLIDNARSFSPAGGSVRVSLAREPRQVVVTVDDDGPGIPEHALERIFERFYTDRPEQGFGQNSGLGLSISRQITEAHGGSIRAENRRAGEGVAGARFVVELPAAGLRKA